MHKTAGPRLALATAALLLVGVLAAGCGSSSSFAYSVNGNEVSQADFNRELDALADNEILAEGYEAGTGTTMRDSEGTVTTEFAARWMSIVINETIIVDAVEDQDIEITDEMREQAEAQAPATFATADAVDGGAGAWEAFPEWFREDIIDRGAAQLALAESLMQEPTDEEVRAAYDQGVGAVAAACESGKFASHILVETEQEAIDLRAQLDEGASFLDLAVEHSTDPGVVENQGFLDCFVVDGPLVGEVEAGIVATPVGEISDPVESQFGWHLLKIDAEPPFDLVEDLIRMNLSQPDPVAVQELVENADVEVDPKYGEWVVMQGQGRVEPPTDDDDETPEAPTQGEINLEELDPELLEQLEQQMNQGTGEETPTGDGQTPAP